MRWPATALIVLSMAAPAAAQQQTTGTAGGAGTSGQGSAPTSVPAKAEQPAVDVDRLPINLNRIRRELAHHSDLEQRDGLNLRYLVQIYGQAPPIQLFTEEDNLLHGPAPYGAPTHQEILNVITPQEFRAPAADFSALFRWLAERQKKKQQQ